MRINRVELNYQNAQQRKDLSFKELIIPRGVVVKGSRSLVPLDRLRKINPEGFVQLMSKFRELAGEIFNSPVEFVGNRVLATGATVEKFSKNCSVTRRVFPGEVMHVVLITKGTGVNDLSLKDVRPVK